MVYSESPKSMKNKYKYLLCISFLILYNKSCCFTNRKAL